jgi:hypothetical protein
VDRDFRRQAARHSRILFLFLQHSMLNVRRSMFDVHLPLLPINNQKSPIGIHQSSASSLVATPPLGKLATVIDSPLQPTTLLPPHFDVRCSMFSSSFSSTDH